jgi:hypothetical protein
MPAQRAAGNGSTISRATNTVVSERAISSAVMW